MKEKIAWMLFLTYGYPVSTCIRLADDVLTKKGWDVSDEALWAMSEVESSFYLQIGCIPVAGVYMDSIDRWHLHFRGTPRDNTRRYHDVDADGLFYYTLPTGERLVLGRVKENAEVQLYSHETKEVA